MGAATTFGLHESNPRIISVRKSKFSASKTLDRGHILNTTILVPNFSIFHAHANGKLKLKDPWLDPHKLVGR